MLHPLQLPIVDGENNPVDLDIAYAVKGGNFLSVLEHIKREYGNVYLLPLSGTSGGGGIFQSKKPADGTVVGLQLTATPTPKTRHTNEACDITTIALDEVVIQQETRHIYAGAGITLQQLNQALSDEVGAQYKVLGADLTSYTYAQVGATFMTGGMGPQRRYFSDSVTEVALYNGDEICCVSEKALDNFAGTYGWTGIVTAVCCRYCELPINETAFAIPVNNNPDDIARLLQHFSPFTYLQLTNGKLHAASGADDIILGLEHITVGAMQPFLRSGDNALTRRAKKIAENCHAADADGLIFVNGYSDSATDEFLLALVDDTEADELTIAGMRLEYTEVFNNPEEMRAVREGVPFAARTQSPTGRFSYKGHTDATIRLNPDNVESAMTSLWQINEKYVSAIEQYFLNQAAIRGEIIVYGHLNPFGVDPHNRVTFASDDIAAFETTVKYVHAQRDGFYQQLMTLCESTNSTFVGGEKSAASEAEIFNAFSDLNNLPRALSCKLKRQRSAIQAASRMFNWRAIAPYQR